MLGEADQTEKQDRHFVTALARGLEVLAAFRAGETWLANHEIAERCKLPRSTVSRLTHTLTTLGYLHYGEERAKYRHGSQLLALSSVALGGLSVRDIARPALREIAASSNATLGLGVRDNLSMRYVECARGKAAIALNIDVGSRISLVRSSMGRAYVAILRDAERNALFDEIRAFDERTWPQHKAALEKSIEDYRRLGCSCSFGDWQADTSAIAVAFRPGAGLPPMAINCGAPTAITPPEYLLQEVRPRLIALARSLEGVMGA
jgi:DNA-binding IclR family transcriptional regulator